MNRLEQADLFFACIIVGLLASVGGLVLGDTTATHRERAEWVAGRHRVVAGHCEQWHAPLKPGDLGWWEKP